MHEPLMRGPLPSMGHPMATLIHSFIYNYSLLLLNDAKLILCIFYLGVIYNCKLEGGVTIPTFREKFNYCNMCSVDDEISLILELANIVKKWDPDILAGYEVSYIVSNVENNLFIINTV